MLKRSSSSGDPGIISSYITWLLLHFISAEHCLSIAIAFGPLSCSILLFRLILDIPHESFSRKYSLSFFIFLHQIYVKFIGSISLSSFSSKILLPLLLTADLDIEQGFSPLVTTTDYLELASHFYTNW
jgi:hypothetical protein